LEDLVAEYNAAIVAGTLHLLSPPRRSDLMTDHLAVPHRYRSTLLLDPRAHRGPRCVALFSGSLHEG